MACSRVEKAVHNNARWCDAVCRAYGAAGEFRDSLWLNRNPVPRFYPNAVTLSAHHADTQQAKIRALADDHLRGDWGVKDSFGSLDLKPLGFRVAFEATWLWRDASSPPLRQSKSDLRWRIIQTESELLQWENAWSDDPTQPRVFLPPLLANREVIFIAGLSQRLPHRRCHRQPHERHCRSIQRFLPVRSYPGMLDRMHRHNSGAVSQRTAGRLRARPATRHRRNDRFSETSGSAHLGLPIIGSHR